MHGIVNIFKSRPFLLSSLSSLLLLACIYHFIYRLGLNLSGLVAIFGFIFFISLQKEIKAFFLESIEKRSNLLILCILFFSGLGVILNFGNVVEIGFFITLFFSFYLIFKGKDNILKNFIFNLVIFSGVLMSVGVLIGLFESIFLSSKLFYQIYDDYPYVDQKFIFSGFGYNHNFSAIIIVVAQSFLFLSSSAVMKNLRKYLTVLFLLALVITGARIFVLFISLIICNYFIQDKIKKNVVNIILVTLYLLAAHIVISFDGSNRVGSIHYNELLFSVVGIDFIQGVYGFIKVEYFFELKDNFFLPTNLKDITQILNFDPHNLIFSLIILGGFPLMLSVLIFLAKGIYENFRVIEEKYPNYYFCGLISIITETFLYDSANSIFFWIIILYAITISKDSYPSNARAKISIN